jgi:hypothetical protein
MTFERLLDPPDVNQIAANADDHALFALSARSSRLSPRPVPEAAALARAASLDFLRCVWNAGHTPVGKDIKCHRR